LSLSEEPIRTDLIRITLIPRHCGVDERPKAEGLRPEEKKAKLSYCFAINLKPQAGEFMRLIPRDS
jgi:hypothetical protein